jgi:hypothetical protein
MNVGPTLSNFSETGKAGLTPIYLKVSQRPVGMGWLGEEKKVPSAVCSTSSTYDENKVIYQNIVKNTKRFLLSFSLYPTLHDLRHTSTAPYIVL